MNARLLINIPDGDPTWRQVQEMLKARINELREQNDEDHTPEETAKIRGRIYELKFLLEAPETVVGSRAEIRSES